MKECDWCKQGIKKGEKATLLETFIEGSKSLEKHYWHLPCYIMWLDDAIIRKVKHNMKATATALFKTLKEVKDNNEQEETDKSNLQQMGIG